MIKKFQHYITETPWDENMIRTERNAKRMLLPFLLLAGLYFGIVAANTLMRMP